MVSETSKIGVRGTAVIPAKLRRMFGLDDGTLVIFEETPDGILIRPAIAMPVERYSPRRKAELLLSNATDAADYAKAVKTIRKMGLDPDAIPHRKPKGA